MKRLLRGATLWLLLGGTGAMLGIVAAAGGLLPAARGRTVEFPLPHLVPPRPERLAFHFAMVDDVIHEQYLRHGEAFHKERVRRMRERLAEMDREGNAKDEIQRFAAMDDLGVSLEALGQHDEAIALMRRKLEEQGKLPADSARYTTYANLGTFLIHESFKAAQAGDAAARTRLEEGLAFIERAIAVNPDAHFGRERWQAVAVDFLLAAMNNPALLLRYDMVGNELEQTPVQPSPLRMDGALYASVYARDVADYVRLSAIPRGEAQVQAQYAKSKSARHAIAGVGAEGDWTAAVHTWNQEPVPFDEPALGIIGMWRVGGGANPHFALALGGIMERVDRPELAWHCYARALELTERFWPSVAVQRGLREHCENRQRYLEGRLGTSREVLQEDFAARLAQGLAGQAAYEEEEARRIAAGEFPEELPYRLELEARSGAGPSLSTRDTVEIPLSGLRPTHPERVVHLLPAALLGAGVMIFLASFIRDLRPSRLVPAR